MARRLRRSVACEIACRYGSVAEGSLFHKENGGYRTDPEHGLRLAPQGLSREHWASAAPVRKIFSESFQRISLSYSSPHSVRNTLTQLAYQLQLTPEEFKAWSQNMGHDQPLTTLNSYGHVTIERQAELIGGLKHKKPRGTDEDTMAELIAEKVCRWMNGQKC
jgi:hypothetical protein